MVRKELLILLALVIGYVFYLRISNPYRQYSSAAFWRNATVHDVAGIPTEALAPGNKNGSVLMFAAGFVSDAEILRRLVARGSRINEQDTLHGTPMSSAATLNPNPKIITALVDLGANVNIRLHEGATPLMTAAQFNSNAEVLRELVTAGLAVDAKDDDGRTALMYAARHNSNVGVARVLVELGANPFTVSAAGESALDIANQSQNDQVAAYLKSLK